MPGETVKTGIGEDIPNALTFGEVARPADLRRRVTYLMLFRLVLISLVLGTTLLVSWLSDVDLSAPNSLVLFTIIATTYLLTIVYSLALGRTEPMRLADIQIGVDLVITALLVHVTGGAQSAYAFFFGLSIIAAAAVRFRVGAVLIAVASMAIFATVSVLGWLDILPSFAGQRLVPSALSSVELSRAMLLNLAAFAGVAVLAYNLGGQIQQASAKLETQRTAAADLRALHEDIIRCLSSGLITIDESGAVLTINRSACEILDIEQAAIVGQSVVRILPGIEKFLSVMPEPEVQRRADLVIPRPGSRDLIMDISVSPLRDNRDQVIGRIVNFQDLTELRAMELKMRQSERLAVIGTLAAGVAHEIRNPLAAISGSIELLRADPQTDDDGRTLMDIVTREVDRLNALITGLLAYTNPQPRELVRFDLVELVSETLAVFNQDPAIGEVSIVLGDKSAADPLWMLADPGRIRQVLWNLLRNAAEAARSLITISLQHDGDQVVIQVRDDGPGVPAEHVERIFDPFFTTKSRGSGLGLPTCHSIITELGGEITVDSAPGLGACFMVRVPVEVINQPTLATGDRI